jgi:hypothetical protein
MKTLTFILTLGTIVSIGLFSSCDDRVELSEYPEQEPDTTLPALNHDLKFTAKIGPDSLIYRDLIGSEIGNGVSSFYGGLCFTDTNGFTYDSRMQGFNFGPHNDSASPRVIDFQLYGCIVDTLNTRRDGLIDLKQYDVGNINNGTSGFMVTYIDENYKVWSTLREDTIPDTQSGSLTITDLIDNYDGFSRYKAAGDFSNIQLYDTAENVMLIEGGQFVTRVGKYY